MSSTFNLIMPGALGGDVVKAIWVSGDTSCNRARNVLSIFFDRAIGFLSLFILGLAAFSIQLFLFSETKTGYLECFPGYLYIVCLTYMAG